MVLEERLEHLLKGRNEALKNIHDVDDRNKLFMCSLFKRILLFNLKYSNCGVILVWMNIQIILGEVNFILKDIIFIDAMQLSDFRKQSFREHC